MFKQVTTLDGALLYFLLFFCLIFVIVSVAEYLNHNSWR